MEWNFLFNWELLVDEAIRRRKERKLTQKMLGLLAQVSTPTISRFEQRHKDIQLSSVIAILDMLGMTDKRTLLFAEEKHSYDESGNIVFWGQDGIRRIRCRISRETLEDFFSKGGLSIDAAFKKHRLTIEALARKKYLCNQIDNDGGVLVTTQDFL